MGHAVDAALGVPAPKLVGVDAHHRALRDEHAGEVVGHALGAALGGVHGVRGRRAERDHGDRLRRGYAAHRPWSDRSPSGHEPSQPEGEVGTCRGERREAVGRQSDEHAVAHRPYRRGPGDASEEGGLADGATSSDLAQDGAVDVGLQSAPDHQVHPVGRVAGGEDLGAGVDAEPVDDCGNRCQIVGGRQGEEVEVGELGLGVEWCGHHHHPRCRRPRGHRSGSPSVSSRPPAAARAVASADDRSITAVR